MGIEKLYKKINNYLIQKINQYNFLNSLFKCVSIRKKKKLLFDNFES